MEEEIQFIIDNLEKTERFIQRIIDRREMAEKIQLKGPVSKLMLNSEQRSMSFDETQLTINKNRKSQNDKNNANAASRMQSIPSSRRKIDLRTDKLVHITELKEDDKLLQNINKVLMRSKRMIMLTGAGISCNAGIPDFRSANGLYNLVKEEFPDLNITSGKEMFDISLFRDESKISVWATFMEKLYSSVQTAKPTTTHRFISQLKKRNKLLRCYTQNIDGLEETLGLETSSKQEHLQLDLDKVLSSSQQNSSDESNNTKNTTSNSSFTSKWKSYDVIQLHGDLNSLACTKCFHVFEWSRSWARSFRKGELPSCPNCEAAKLKRTREGKRLIENTGILRPNIVLYGENHPSGELISKGLHFDMLRGKPDLFIIMGTSLKVDGVKRLVKQVSKQVHERGGLVLLINKTTVGDSSWHGVIDYQIQEDCDNWVDYLEDEIPDLFKSQRKVERERMLKREASELRKKKAEEMKKHDEAKKMYTPPTTPVRDIDLTSDEEVSHEKTVLDLKNVKRQLIAPHHNSQEEQHHVAKKIKV